MTLVLEGATVIDGTGADPLVKAAVTVAGDRIEAVGRSTRSLRGQRLDLSGLTVLPGLIDLHTHLGVVEWEGNPALSPAMTAALIFDNCRRCLLSGHTTVRDAGGVDGALSAVIDAGLVAGPRVFPSGPLLSQTGGHGDMTPPFAHRPAAGITGLSQPTLICDGPEGVRLAARQAFRAGATQLKVCSSGGVLSHADNMTDCQFTVAELRAAVEEAAARGTYVTAHAHHPQAIRNGLDAGITCFEHGTLLDEDTANAMARAGAALVPTLTVAHLLSERWQEWGLPAEFLPRAAGLEEAMLNSIELAMTAGVNIGSGTDLRGPRQEGRGLELTLKAKVMGPMGAIVSATSASARILRRPDLGVIAPGKLADLIAIDGDPLAHPELWPDPDRVVLVIKNGVITKDTRPKKEGSPHQHADPIFG
jgi:imidazolonepropionase-like amidohydrolase